MTKYQERKKPNTVNVLRNPNMISGRVENRLGNIILFLGLILIPPILLLSLFISLISEYGIGPFLTWAIPIYIYYVWRITARMLLHEKQRIKRYKHELESKYDEISNITSVNLIYPTGEVEYYNGTFSIFIICKNGNRADAISRSQYIEKFFSSLQPFEVNSIYCFNEVDTTALDLRYSRIQILNEGNIAKDTLDIIEYNKSHIASYSLMTYTVYEIKGHSTSKVTLRNVVQNSLRHLKAVYREAIIADDNQANTILNRILKTNIDFRNLYMASYAKGNYYGSKVLGYTEDAVPKEAKKHDTLNKVPTTIEGGFIPCQKE